MNEPFAREQTAWLYVRRELRRVWLSMKMAWHIVLRYPAVLLLLVGAPVLSALLPWHRWDLSRWSGSFVALSLARSPRLLDDFLLVMVLAGVALLVRDEVVSERCTWAAVRARLEKVWPAFLLMQIALVVFWWSVYSWPTFYWMQRDTRGFYSWLEGWGGWVPVGWQWTEEIFLWAWVPAVLAHRGFRKSLAGAIRFVVRNPMLVLLLWLVDKGWTLWLSSALDRTLERIADVEFIFRPSFEGEPRIGNPLWNHPKVAEGIGLALGAFVGVVLQLLKLASVWICWRKDDPARVENAGGGEPRPYADKAGAKYAVRS